MVEARGERHYSGLEYQRIIVLIFSDQAPNMCNHRHSLVPERRPASACQIVFRIAGAWVNRYTGGQLRKLANRIPRTQRVSLKLRDGEVSQPLIVQIIWAAGERGVRMSLFCFGVILWRSWILINKKNPSYIIKYIIWKEAFGIRHRRGCGLKDDLGSNRFQREPLLLYRLRAQRRFRCPDNEGPMAKLLTQRLWLRWSEEVREWVWGTALKL